MGFSRQEYWNGLHSLLQGIFLTQVSNPGLLYWKQILYHLRHQSTMLCYVLCLVTQLCPTLCNPMDYSLPGSSVHGDSPGKNTGVGCYAFLQRIFPLQGSNPGLLNCRQILYCLSCQGSPRILELVAYPFSRGSSQQRNRTGVSCIAGRFFTSWATRETLVNWHQGSPINYEVKSLSRVQLFATPWTVADQAPQSMGFSRHEYWSGLLFPSPGDLPHPGIKPGSPTL